MTARTATILVTDLVGSTELRVRLGEERAEVLRQVHDRLACDAVDAVGGTVVKSLGDGVLATFAGAAEAVSAAIGIQQAAATHTRHHPETPLVLRAGISAGDVETEGTDVFGTPVVEAARLCALAESGQILVAELVRLLSRGRGGHQFREVGALALKGLPDPVPTAEVVWTARPRPVLPPLLQVAGPFAMFGRQAERERLRQLWRETVAAGSHVALVAGEPGIGKTRLMAELAGDTADDGALVVYGHCDEELNAPYRPWVEVVRALLARLPPDVSALHTAQAGGVLSRLVPGLGVELGPEGDAETERLRLFDAVAELVQRAAARTPLLVVLDDMHWADRSSLLLLRHLVMVRSDLPWMLVATYRDTELSHRHPLAVVLADLRRVPGIERLALQGLDAAAVEQLLAERAGRRPDSGGVSAVARRLEAETAGNPFFIEEMVSHLSDSGGDAREGPGVRHERLVEGGSVPEGVRDAVGRRVGSLPEAAAEILMAAAVVGSEFDAAVVAQVLAKPFDEVIEVLDLVLARRLLVELPGRFGRYRFAHALVRQTLEQELSRTRRVRLHHRIALTLEQTGASATELARHFTAGAPDGDADKAVDWLRRAAAEALRSLAYDEAVTQYRAALDALGLAGAHGAEERADLLMLLAGAANKAGDDDAWRAAALEAADIARRLNDPERLARAAFSLLGTLGSAVEVDENVVAVIRDAADLVRADDRAPAQQALLAELLARLGAYLATGSPHDSAAMLDEALEIARRGENPRVLAIALLNSTLTYTLDQNENQARLREAAQIAEAGGDPEVVLAANTGLMIGALLWADRAEFDRSLTEYARVAAATGAVTPLLLNAINHAGAAALDGRYAEAQAAFENARSRAVALRDPSHLVAITAGMLPVTRELGHARDVASARQSATRKPLLPIAEAFHVWALSEAGEREAAAERLHLLLAQPEAILSGYLRRLTLAVLTEATDLLGDTRAAAQLSRWWQSEAGHGACVNVGAHSYHGALERYLGLTALTLNHANEAVHHHQRALGLHERMRAKGWAARSHYDLARALVARGEPGDVERAARLIDETIGSAHELGMPKLLEELLTLGE